MDNVEVPLSIVSAPTKANLSAVVIGSTQYKSPAVENLSFWFSVYDRSTLAQVFSVVQDAHKSDVVPPDLAGKYNTPQYFLVLATTGLYSFYLPGGALYNFLVSNGASTQLKWLIQANKQVGCGAFGPMTYALAGVLGPGQPTHPRVELGSVDQTTSQYLEATLIGVTTPTGTVYSPFPLTPPPVPPE